MEPNERHARQSNVVKSLLPIDLRYSYKDSWLYKVDYYDDPEGVNLIGKLVATNRKVIIPAVVLAWCDITMISKVTEYQKVIGRFGYWSYPFVTAASCFTIATYAATNIRKTDDTWNYIIGAFAAGGAVGMWHQSYLTGWSSGCLFALAAFAKRVSIEEGWSFCPAPTYMPGGLRTHKHDWSVFTSSIPKGYDIVTKQ